MVEDVMQSLVDGAKAARMTSALRKNGVPHLMTMRADIEARMEKYACPSIHRRRDIMRETSAAEPAVFGRADCMKRLWSSRHGSRSAVAVGGSVIRPATESVRCAILNERVRPGGRRDGVLLSLWPFGPPGPPGPSPARRGGDSARVT
jgi:hypothetical protein